MRAGLQCLWFAAACMGRGADVLLRVCCLVSCAGLLHSAAGERENLLIVRHFFIQKVLAGAGVCVWGVKTQQ